MDRVDRVLGMSARRLQPGLRLDGTTFAAVLTQLRHDMAGPLLRDGQQAVTEVAFWSCPGFVDGFPLSAHATRGACLIS